MLFISYYRDFGGIVKSVCIGLAACSLYWAGGMLILPRSYDSLRASLRSVARLYGVCGRTCAVTKVQEFFYCLGAET